MNRLLALPAFALFLVACVSGPPSPGPAALYQARDIEFKAAVGADRTIDPIRGRLPLVGGPSEITFAMLADTTTPTEEQRVAIRRFAEVWQPFRERIYVLDQQYQPQFARVNEAERMAVSALLADLYNRTLTFGEYAKKRQEVRVIADQARDQIRSAAAANAAAAEQASIARFNSYLLTQQALQLQQQQTIRLQTTCSRVGTFLFCN